MTFPVGHIEHDPGKVQEVESIREAASEICAEIERLLSTPRIWLIKVTILHVALWVNARVRVKERNPDDLFRALYLQSVEHAWPLERWESLSQSL